MSTPKARREEVYHGFFEDGSALSISKLKQRVKGRVPKDVGIDSLVQARCDRLPKKTCLSKKRLKKTDTNHPILVGFNNEVIDGRHRVFKGREVGANHIKAIRVTRKDLEAAKVL